MFLCGNTMHTADQISNTHTAVLTQTGCTATPIGTDTAGRLPWCRLVAAWLLGLHVALLHRCAGVANEMAW